MCCGLYGENSYRAKKILVPKSCTFEQHQEISSYEGCFDIVKKLEAKLLNPVIILTFFCSFLQVRKHFFIFFNCYIESRHFKNEVYIKI